MIKYEWKKEEKKIYIPKTTPEIINIPKMKYFTITGKGNPNNNQEFQDKIGVLYSLSYAIKMMPKNGFTPNGYFEYTVYPLEGVWDLTEKGRKSDTLNKDELIYTLMIRQPDFVNDEVVTKAFEITKKKKQNPLLEQVKFVETEEGLCVQMMHIGPYDDEPKSFAKMEKFTIENNYSRKSMLHKEIYLSDFRKVAQDKLRTVLRYSIQNKKI